MLHPLPRVFPCLLALACVVLPALSPSALAWRTAEELEREVKQQQDNPPPRNAPGGIKSPPPAPQERPASPEREQPQPPRERPAAPTEPRQAPTERDHRDRQWHQQQQEREQQRQEWQRQQHERQWQHQQHEDQQWRWRQEQREREQRDRERRQEAREWQRQQDAIHSHRHLERHEWHPPRPVVREVIRLEPRHSHSSPPYRESFAFELDELYARQDEITHRLNALAAREDELNRSHYWRHQSPAARAKERRAIEHSRKALHKQMTTTRRRIGQLEHNERTFYHRNDEFLQDRYGDCYHVSWRFGVRELTLARRHFCQRP